MEEKKLKQIYIVGLTVSAVVMVLLFLFTSVLLNVTFLVFFYAIRFLSGFGLILSISNGILIIMDKLSNRIGKRGTTALIILEIVIPGLLIAYAIYKIISSFLENSVITQTGIWLWFDNILYIYGIASLLLTLYIIPLANEQFYKAVELSKFTGVGKGAKTVARKVKKKYFSLRKEYAKVQVQDQMSIKEILDLWRNKFAVNFLLVIAVGSLVFAPIAFICVMYWLRLYVFFRADSKNYERFSLLIAMIWIGFIAIISPFLNLAFYTAIAPYFWTVNVAYLIGILLATLIFISKLLSYQGITFRKVKIGLKDRKIEKLEREKEELEKQLDKKEEE